MGCGPAAAAQRDGRCERGPWVPSPWLASLVGTACCLPRVHACVPSPGRPPTHRPAPQPHTSPAAPGARPLPTPLPLCAVKVRLRKDARFKLAWMHDLEARVGSTPPSLRTAAAASAGGSPHTLNARCALLPGQAGTALGQLLRLQCARPLRGRYITLQIR